MTLSLVAKENNSLNSDLFKPSTISFWLYIDSVQMLTVSSSGMLLKSKSTSKLPLQKGTVLFNDFFCKRKRVLNSEFVNCQATQYRE